MKKFAQNVLLAAALVGVFFSISTVSVAAQTGGIGGRPAHPDPKNPRTESIFIYTISKGEGKNDEVVISNNTDKQQTIEVYAVDALTTNTGSFSCKQKAETATDVGGWIRLAKSEVTLEPATHENIPFTLTAPLLADVGEHNGCLVFQQKGDESIQRQGSVRLSIRQAVRVAVTIPGALKKEVSLTHFSVSREKKNQFFDLTFNNTGNVSVDINADVRLKNVFGGTEFREGGGYPILSGKDLKLRFINQKPPFWGGWYVAEAEGVYDKRPSVFGTTDQRQLKHTAKEQKIVFITPSLIAATIYLAIIFLIIIIIVYILRKSYLQKQAKTTWGIYRVAAGESIDSIAKQYGISWKKLASVNGIKPPYQLEQDAKIKVPNKSKK